MYYFITGFFTGALILSFYNLILLLISKVSFMLFKTEGNLYFSRNMIFLSNISFIALLLNIILPISLYKLSLIIFIFFPIIQNLILEEEYNKEVILKNISFFVIFYISFSTLSSILYLIV